MANTKHTGFRCLDGCPVEASLQIIGGKWKGMILYQLVDGPVRFTQLARRIPGASARVLARALRELEADGLIARTVYPTVPPAVDYRLTSEGDGLRPIVQALAAFGRGWLERRAPLYTVAAE
jgi:DNA-binding HxlR family transcriptional regulator